MPEYDKHANYLIAPNAIVAVHRLDGDGLYQSTDFLRRDEKGMIFINYRATTVSLPMFDPSTHQARFVYGTGWEIEPLGSSVVERPIALSEAKKKKLADLAAYRFQVETGGISFLGSSIRTDRESQAQLTSAYISLKFGLADTVDWKGPNGWTALRLEQIEPVAQAVTRHVQTSFSMEKVHTDAINNLTTVEEVMAYDITVGF